MKPKIKTKWLAALRSGEYRKSTRVLKRHYSTKPGHCCLGVLCEIIKDDFPRAAELIAPSNVYGTAAKPSVNATLDHETLEYVEMGLDRMKKLATMNDNGKRFSRIADYIEKHL